MCLARHLQETAKLRNGDRNLHIHIWFQEAAKELKGNVLVDSTEMNGKSSRGRATNPGDNLREKGYRSFGISWPYHQNLVKESEQ